jgi:hypothetical protein
VVRLATERSSGGKQYNRFYKLGFFFSFYTVFQSHLLYHCRSRGLLLHLITVTDTHTLFRTPLDEGSARRRVLYLTTHNTHKTKTCVLPAGFEPAIPVSERPLGSAVIVVTKNEYSASPCSRKKYRLFLRMGEWVKLCLYLEDGGNRSLSNVGKFLPDYTTSPSLQEQYICSFRFVSFTAPNVPDTAIKFRSYVTYNPPFRYISCVVCAEGNTKELWTILDGRPVVYRKLPWQPHLMNVYETRFPLAVSWLC